MANGKVHFPGYPASIPVGTIEMADGNHALMIAPIQFGGSSNVVLITASGNPIAGPGVLTKAPFVRMPAGGTLRLYDSTTASGSDLMSSGATFTFNEAYTGPIPTLEGVRFTNGVYATLSGAGAELMLAWCTE